MHAPEKFKGLHDAEGALPAAVVLPEPRDAQCEAWLGHCQIPC